MSNQSPITIRKGTDADVELLAYSASEMIRETEGRILDLEKIRSGVRKILADPDRGFYLVAEYQGKKVGSLQVSPHWIDLLDGCMWWLQCAYIQPKYRKSGCFKMLRERAFEIAKDNPEVKMLRSLVHPTNDRMQTINEGLGWIKSDVIEYYNRIPEVKG